MHAGGAGQAAIPLACEPPAHPSERAGGTSTSTSGDGGGGGGDGGGGGGGGGADSPSTAAVATGRLSPAPSLAPTGSRAISPSFSAVRVARVRVA